MAKRSRKNGGGSTAGDSTPKRKVAGVRIPRSAPSQTSGSGFHEPNRYGKIERRSAKAEIQRDLG